VYPNINSAMRPIRHDDSLPVPEPPEMNWHFQNKWNVKMVLHLKPFSTLQTINASQRRGPQNLDDLISRNLNDLIRDLSLSKDKAELLASRLKEINLLDSDVRVCHYRIRNNVLKTFF
jgi:hypothetical protein